MAVIYVDETTGAAYGTIQHGTDDPQDLVLETYAYMGDASATNYATQIAFQGVAIPQGSTIDSAVLSMKASSSPGSGTTCKVRFSCLNYDNGGSGSFGLPATYAECINTTTAVVDMTVDAWTADTVYASSDLSTIFQEIVDRTGWHSGQVICLSARDNGSSDNAYRVWWADHGLSYLTITWTVPATKAISGSVKRFGTGVDGVTMTFSAGLGGGTATTAGGGLYTKSVAHDTSGTVTPSKAGETFTPTSKSYTYVRAAQANQDYVMVAYVVPPSPVAFSPKNPTYSIGTDIPRANIAYEVYAPSRNIYNIGTTNIAYSAETPTYWTDVIDIRKRFHINAIGERISLKFANADGYDIVLKDVGMATTELERRTGVSLNAKGSHISLKFQNNTVDEKFELKYVKIFGEVHENQ